MVLVYGLNNIKIKMVVKEFVYNSILVIALNGKQIKNVNNYLINVQQMVKLVFQ